MDIKHFFKLLKMYKWWVIIIPLLTIILSYILVKDLPKEYRSNVQISTGLIDQSQQINSSTNNQDFFKVNSQFSNIIEIMKMDKSISNLSYRLILHDLADENKSFTPWSEELKSYAAADQQKMIAEYSKLMLDRTVITPAMNKELKLYDILVSMQYDPISLNKNISIYHVDNSDFITVEYTSNDPELSSFTVNTFANDFIGAYSVDVVSNQNKSNNLLDSVLKQKEQIMNDKNAALKNYKINNGVLNLDKQSELIYQQINDYEQKKSSAIQEIQANQGAIASIDKRLASSDKTFSGGNVIAGNNRILNIRNQLKIANDRYVDNNFRAEDKNRVDSLQNILSEQISNNSDKYVADPTANKQNLITQKMNLQVTLDLARNSVQSIDAQLSQLKAKYNTMVPFDAGVQNFERDADVATKEYLEVLNRSNTNSLEKNIGLRLQVAQAGFPGIAEPSKAILYTIFAGLASFMMCIMAVVVVFLLDNSINSSIQLEKATNSKVIGSLNKVSNSGADIRDIWKNESGDNKLNVFKDNLRSLRFEVDQSLLKDESKILGVTSLADGEGKTFLASSLVYAFAMTGKKVLLISGEKDEAVPSQKLIPEQFFETFIVKKEIQAEDLITVLNNKSDKTSLLEIQNKSNLASGFNILKEEFDIIIIDMNSLEKINRAKEWLLFTDKHIAVFAAGQSINESAKDNIKYITEHNGFAGWVLNKQIEG